MFGSIGILELVIIAGVALMILGPEKFPEFAKMAARLVRDVRGYATEIQREITKEIKPVQKELDDLRKIDPETYIDSLIGDDDDEDDGTINLEPDPSTMELYGADSDQEYIQGNPPADEVPAGPPHDETTVEAPGQESGGEEVEVESYDTYPYEEQQSRTEDPAPEKLDG